MCTYHTHVKYLGIELDQSLTGDGVAEKIISKSNAKLKFLYRQTRNVNIETNKLLTSALVHCHFDYASSSWYSGLTKKYKARLQCTQNKVIRFLLNAPARTHIGANHEVSSCHLWPHPLAQRICFVEWMFTESVLATLMYPHAILLPNRHVIWFEVWSRHSIAAKIYQVTTSMILAQNGVWWSVNVCDIVLGHLRTIEVH